MKVTVTSPTLSHVVSLLAEQNDLLRRLSMLLEELTEPEPDQTEHPPPGLDQNPNITVHQDPDVTVRLPTAPPKHIPWHR